MANASRDENNVPSLLAVSSSDGTTIVKVYADPTTHRLLVNGTTSGTVTTITSNDGSITVNNPTTTPDLSVVSSPKLTTARTIGGVSFDGTANITVASATGGFTISGGNLALGANSITMSGALAATGTRVTKGWFTDLESTNMPTVGGVAILTSLTAPQFTTIELGNASDTTLSRSAGGVLAVEGVVIPSISSTNTLTNKRITRRVVTTTQSATPTINTDNTDVAAITGLAQAITSMTTNLSGTPVAGDVLEIQITDNGTARAITWGASFEASGNVALPTTTVISTLLSVIFEWNTATTKWRCQGVA